jgi:hypothetical protein
LKERLLNNRLFRFCRFLVRKNLKPYTVVQNSNFEEPAASTSHHSTAGPKVYIVHHQNLRGPITSMAWFNQPLRPWVLSVFCERQSCFDQFYNYTFTERFGFKRPLAAIISFPISFFVPALMRSTNVIPVYRQPRETIKTFRQSLEALAAGENLLISPDVDYASTSDETGEVYDGFLSLEKHYYRTAKEHISFIPLHIDVKERRILIGSEIIFREDINFREAKSEAAQRLRAEMDRLERGLTIT